MINLCIPTIRRFDCLKKLVESTRNGSLIPDRIIIIDNSCGKCPAIEETEIIVSDRNLGVAGSWNKFMSLYPDDINILLNDDVEPCPETIQNFIKYIYENPGYGMYYADGYTGSSFSFFYVPRAIYNEVGPFDEMFFPAYYEDNDYAYRFRLKGYQIVKVPNTPYSHVGSATLKSYDPTELEQHHKTFRANQTYYIKKWGGMPELEKYKTPFNNRI